MRTKGKLRNTTIRFASPTVRTAVTPARGAGTRTTKRLAPATVRWTWVTLRAQCCVKFFSTTARVTGNYVALATTRHTGTTVRFRHTTTWVVGTKTGYIFTTTRLGGSTTRIA